MKAIVVGGVKSGSGKTSVSLGLMCALARQGRAVQPFKVGPDFIDPGHHALAAGRASHNLDGWMCGLSGVEEIFSRAVAGLGEDDAAVVEGVMGLYDGFSGTDEAGSTAQIAKWLGLPVLLVVDARAMARSAAAVVQGFARFDPDLRLAGVIFNQVGSDAHRELLAEAMTLVPEVPLLGCLARRDDLVTPSRHLGLVQAHERGFDRAAADALADWIDAGCDLDRLLAACVRPDLPPRSPADLPAPRARIGVARDEAFSFYYEDNLRRLALAGAELVAFSPVHDRHLPENLDGLYLGGGYPELAGHKLSNNTSLRRELKRFCESGRPVLAECGGFMLLMDAIQGVNGQSFQMAGVFPFRAEVKSVRAALGYRALTTTADSLLGPSGTLLRGHEFHYSAIPAEAYQQAGLFAASTRSGPLGHAEGFVHAGTVATYVHLHFAGSPEVPLHFVDACVRARAGEAAPEPAAP